MKSCLDWYHAGAHTNGIYRVRADTIYPVFCDFESEANSIWTLVMSFSLSNKYSFRKLFSFNDQNNDMRPNWESYR